jgi:hypothetical protein
MTTPREARGPSLGPSRECLGQSTTTFQAVCLAEPTCPAVHLLEEAVLCSLGHSDLHKCREPCYLASGEWCAAALREGEEHICRDR